MTLSADTSTQESYPGSLSERLQVRLIGFDDFSDLRYLHATSLTAHTAAALSEAEIASFVALVYSPCYPDMLLREEVYGGWIDGALVGTCAWHVDPNDSLAARIGPLFVAHTRLGIGRQLLAIVEARAGQSGFREFAAWSTGNAVPFFERLGYQVASRGVKVLSPACRLPVTFMRKSEPCATACAPE
jgi:N-acetylglutamate synthase-like GNAT family acetyltransferase